MVWKNTGLGLVLLTSLATADLPGCDTVPKISCPIDSEAGYIGDGSYTAVSWEGKRRFLLFTDIGLDDHTRDPYALEAWEQMAWEHRTTIDASCTTVITKWRQRGPYGSTLIEGNCVAQQNGRGRVTINGQRYDLANGQVFLVVRKSDSLVTRQIRVSEMPDAEEDPPPGEPIYPNKNLETWVKKHPVIGPILFPANSRS